jgi:hypothetical protein
MEGFDNVLCGRLNRFPLEIDIPKSFFLKIITGIGRRGYILLVDDDS